MDPSMNRLQSYLHRHTASIWISLPTELKLNQYFLSPIKNIYFRVCLQTLGTRLKIVLWCTRSLQGRGHITNDCHCYCSTAGNRKTTNSSVKDITLRLWLSWRMNAINMKTSITLRTSQQVSLHTHSHSAFTDLVSALKLLSPNAYNKLISFFCWNTNSTKTTTKTQKAPNSLQKQFSTVWLWHIHDCTWWHKDCHCQNWNYQKIIKVVHCHV